MEASEYETFGELRARLDEIVVEVRNKDLSLEKSLDLYEEAIQLGNRCAELVDKPDYTAVEAARVIAGDAPEVSISGQLAAGEDGDAVGDSAGQPGKLDSCAPQDDSSEQG